MRKSLLEILISFFLGVSWAVALLGALLAFEIFLSMGFWIAIFAAVVGSFIGLGLVVVLEIVNLNIEKLKEIKKQTELLREIRECMVREKLPHHGS